MKGYRVGATADTAQITRDEEPVVRIPMEKVYEMYHSGDPALKAKATEIAYRQYTKYIYSLARQYYGSFMKMHGEDFFSAGTIGLLEGLESFDPAKGAFTTCCKPLILSEMSALAANVSNAGTQHYSNIHKKVNRAIDDLRKNGIEPTVTQIAYRTGLKREAVASALEVINRINFVYMDDGSINNYVSDSYEDPERIMIEKERSEELHRAMEEDLDDELRVVVQMKFGLGPYDDTDGMKYPAISDRVNISVSKARYDVQKGIRKLHASGRLAHLRSDSMESALKDIDNSNITSEFPAEDVGSDLERMLNINLGDFGDGLNA